MPLVNRLLDVFFRTLDAVDLARERIDRVLGRAPRSDPWSSEWSSIPETPTAARASAPEPTGAPRQRGASDPSASPPASRRERAKPKSATPKAKSAGSKGSGAAGRAKKAGANRKGSVDRSGKDFDSPRARAILEKLGEAGVGVVTESADHGGKRVLARVLWALLAADRAGSELGLTAADASALLHLAAGMEVYATNVARACRDETELIEESVPDGRSKRYKLTAAGKTEAAKVATRQT